ncbi:MAG TPA: hypothetical protein VLF69_05045 [Candidatus Saccharimonadales bacterium]|nr:hypothetical protein [Candidatus Saccharimonadales bacterium]
MGVEAPTLHGTPDGEGDRRDWPDREREMMGAVSLGGNVDYGWGRDRGAGIRTVAPTAGRASLAGAYPAVTSSFVHVSPLTQPRFDQASGESMN